MHATQDGGEDTCLLASRECFRAPSRQAIETGGSQQECNAKLRLSVVFLSRKKKYRVMVVLVTDQAHSYPYRMELRTFLVSVFSLHPM